MYIGFKKLQGLAMLIAMILLASLLSGCGNNGDVDPTPDQEEITEEVEVENNEEDLEEDIEDKIKETVTDIITDREELTMMAEALGTTEVKDQLKKGEPITVLAPTNKAFEDLIQSLGMSSEEFMEQVNLPEVLENHLIAGKNSMDEMRGKEKKITFAEFEIVVEKEETFEIIHGPYTAMVSQTDLLAKDGVVHIIDRVLVPETYN